MCVRLSVKEGIDDFSCSTQYFLFCRLPPVFSISLISVIMYLGYASVHLIKHRYLLCVKHPVLNMDDNKMSEYSPHLKELNTFYGVVKQEVHSSCTLNRLLFP